MYMIELNETFCTDEKSIDNILYVYFSCSSFDLRKTVLAFQLLNIVVGPGPAGRRLEAEKAEEKLKMCQVGPKRPLTGQRNFCPCSLFIYCDVELYTVQLMFNFGQNPRPEMVFPWSITATFEIGYHPSANFAVRRFVRVNYQFCPFALKICLLRIMISGVPKRASHHVFRQHRYA